MRFRARGSSTTHFTKRSDRLGITLVTASLLDYMQIKPLGPNPNFSLSNGKTADQSSNNENNILHRQHALIAN
jgi:hypothetical protein